MIGTASAPASSGNLGPGFDALALAVDIRCHASAEVSDDMTVDDGEGPVEVASTDIISRAVLAAAGRPMAITLTNPIPRTRGLGSSSAVIVSSAAAAIRASGRDVDIDDLFHLAAEVEGHDDNAAAAVYGGLVVATGGVVRFLQIHPSLHPVVGVPEQLLKTSDARAALADSVSRGVAVRSVVRAICLVEGLRTADAGWLALAGGDELHEGPRATLSPLTGEMIQAARQAGALHAAWSGAGPSALAVVPSDLVGAVVAALATVLGPSGTVLTPAVSTDGVR